VMLRWLLICDGLAIFACDGLGDLGGKERPIEPVNC